jgi:hypothetical protein
MQIGSRLQGPPDDSGSDAPPTELGMDHAPQEHAVVRVRGHPGEQHAEPDEPPVDESTEPSRHRHAPLVVERPVHLIGAPQLADRVRRVDGGVQLGHRASVRTCQRPPLKIHGRSLKRARGARNFFSRYLEDSY